MNARRRTRRIRPIRRAVQVGVLILLAAIPILSALKVDFLKGTLCAIGFDEHTIACALGVLQTSLASGSIDPRLWLSGVFFVALAMVLGRVFCSWVCPQGLASETADGIVGRFRRRRGVADSPARRRRGRILLLSFLGLGLAGSYALGVPVLCYICPIGIICRNLVSTTYFGTVGAELVVVGAILGAEAFIARRGWCKYLCPVGALYGVCASRFSVGIQRDASACVSCRSCERDCSMGNAPVDGIVGPTCTNCGDCLDACPEGSLGLGRGRTDGDHRSLPIVRE